MTARDVRPCCCGGTVVAPVHAPPRLIEQAVRWHQSSQRHRDWRAAGGMEQPGPAPLVRARGWVYEHGYLVPVG